MNENNFLKTLGFAAVAAVAATGAWFSKPQPPKQLTSGSLVGQAMFPKATPKDVTRMEIMQYDQTNHKAIPFEVAQVNDKWSIPSHSNYPADAKDHLAEAATVLMGVKVLDLAFGSGDELNQLDAAAIRARHNEYGVVDPDPEKIKSSDKGIGTRVTLKNNGGSKLAEIVIGKEVPDRTEQRYVRYADKDQVFTVALDTSKLSTHFEDWIERNLLNLNSMDLKQVQIKDYSIELNGNRGGVRFNGEMALDYVSSGDVAWKLTEDKEFKNKAFVPRTMLPDEEVDVAKMNELKNALDDLKIVDVERKPAAVPPDLRFKQSEVTEEILESLQSRGFYPAEDAEKGPGYVQLFSNKGDIRLQLTDGASYMLRFGEVTGESSAAAKKSADKKGANKKDADKLEKKDESAPGLNRYLFVMAEFNPDSLPKPKMDPVPEEPKLETPSADASKTDAPKADDKKDGDKKPDDKKADEKKADEGKKDAPKADAPKPDPAKALEKAKAERERIIKENKRKQDDYDAKLAAGKKHTDELNKRFAPWYYVISDDVYKKIHLSRQQIIKKKSSGKEGHDHEHEHDHADEPGAQPPAEQPKPGPVGELNKATQGGPSEK